MTVAALASGLANFVYDHRNNHGSFSWDKGLPAGYAFIGVFQGDEPTGNWRYFQAFEVHLAAKEWIDTRIMEKNARINDYRKFASEVWLLIVNDLFLGSGEVHARSDDLGRWTFTFDFDRVFLFSRQPGGFGSVIELHRN